MLTDKQLKEIRKELCREREKVVVKENKEEPKIYGEYQNIKKGNIIFDDCTGPCTGGATYGIGDRVIEVNDEAIYTCNSKFSREDGTAIAPPWAYYILFWQKGK